MWRCEYMSRMTAPTLTTTCPPARLGGVGSLGSGRPRCPQLSTGGLASGPAGLSCPQPWGTPPHASRLRDAGSWLCNLQALPAHLSRGSAWHLMLNCQSGL